MTWKPERPWMPIGQYRTFSLPYKPPPPPVKPNYAKLYLKNTSPETKKDGSVQNMPIRL
jgi:hypothetical protein